MPSIIIKIKQLLLKKTPVKYFAKGRRFFNDPFYLEGQRKNKMEMLKNPSRTDIINFLVSLKQNNTCYLEIGVRDPAVNFNRIKAHTKYSVDPGAEFKENPVDFKMTSDDFFDRLSKSEILSNDIKFDIIFIDGLHLAHQVDKDIENALKYIKNDGFIVLHDCNPSTEWHARESYYYFNSPAGSYWNGSTWKAFLKRRFDPTINSCCIDSDFGVGIISKYYKIGNSIEPSNFFFEFNLLEANRVKYLNLIDFNTFKTFFEH